MATAKSINSVFKRFTAVSTVSILSLLLFLFYSFFLSTDDQPSVFGDRDSTSNQTTHQYQLKRFAGLIALQLGEAKSRARTEMQQQIGQLLPQIHNLYRLSGKNDTNSQLDSKAGLINFSGLNRQNDYQLLIYRLGSHDGLRHYLNKFGIKGYMSEKLIENLNNAHKKNFGLFEITDGKSRSLIMAYRFDPVSDALICLWLDSEEKAADITSSLIQSYAVANQSNGINCFMIDAEDNFYLSESNKSAGFFRKMQINSTLLKEIRYTSVAYGAGSLEIDSGNTEQLNLFNNSDPLIIHARFIPEADLLIGVLENKNNIPSHKLKDRMKLLEIIAFGLIVAIFCMLHCLIIRKIINRIYQDLHRISGLEQIKEDDLRSAELQKYNFRDLQKVAQQLNALYQKADDCEQKTAASEQRYQNLFQSNSIPLWEKDITDLLEANKVLLDSSASELSSRIALISRDKWFSYLRMIKNLDANLATLNLFGYNYQNDLFAEIDPLLSADNCFLLKEIIKALHQQRKIIRIEKNITTFNGKLLDLLITISFQIKSSKAIILISMVDITLQKKTARQLAEEKEFILETLSNVTDGVIAIDRSLLITLANKTASEFLNINPDMLIGKHIIEVLKQLNAADRLMLDRLIKSVAQNGKTAESEEAVVFYNINGIEHTVIPIVVAVVDSERQFNGAVITFKDISNQKKLEKELVVTKNMEAIGNLSGGFAHEFNNYLQAILGNITLAGIYAAENQKVLQKVDSAKDLCLKAKTVTERLLTFSLLGKPSLENNDPEVFLTNTLHELLEDRYSNIQLNIGKNLKMISIDCQQMRQVLSDLLNFMISDAGPDAEIVITAENFHYNNNGSLQLEAGDYVRISFLEKGRELPTEVLRRIFDPYFTNKEIGVGLALASAFYTLINHHGLIEAYSTAGVGNTFCFYLPAHKQSVSFLQNEKSRGKRKKILIMDDDEQIRELACEMLDYSGFDTIATVEGSETVSLYAKALQENAPFDLVILDLHVASGMNGQETMEQLKKLDPAIKALVSSGFTSDKVLADFQEYGFLASVNKPYAFQELLNAINLVLKEDE